MRGYRTAGTPRLGGPRIQGKPPRYRRVMLSWGNAMHQALYGEHGFYRSQGEPGDHFRTSVSASPLFAHTLAQLVIEVDTLLKYPSSIDVVDVGAADGAFLSHLLDALPDKLRQRVNAVAVELRQPSTNESSGLSWTMTLPTRISGVVFANEWLDNIPVDVVERTESGVVDVLVDPTTGEETLGLPISDDAQRWLDNWWPLSTAKPGARAEVGLTRDHAWSDLMNRVDRGVGVAIDYSHTRAERATGIYGGGTLAGYRDGRQLVPIPDGTCDITAHVALDSCAERAHTLVTETRLTTQRRALTALGLTSVRPPLTLATDEPALYVSQLNKATLAGELLDRGGLGRFGWLVQSRGTRLPASLGACEPYATV